MFDTILRQAVLDAEADVPSPVVRRNGGSPARGFAVYRNNVYSSLIDVLESRFFVTSRLVGDEFFRAMARCDRKPALEHVNQA